MFQYWLEYVPRPGLWNYQLCFSIDWSMYHALGYGTILYVSVLTGVCTMPWITELSSMFQYWLEYVPCPWLQNYHLCFSIDWSMYHALGYGTINYVSVLTGVCIMPWIMELSSMFQYWLEYVPRPRLQNYHLCFSIDWSMYHALGYRTILYVSVLTGVCTMP